MTVKQRIYVDGFKEQALAKVLGRSDDQSIRSIAADLGMNMGTLRGWMKRALRDQKKPSGKAIASADWTAAQRLLALQESHGLDPGHDSLATPTSAAPQSNPPTQWPCPMASSDRAALASSNLAVFPCSFPNPPRSTEWIDRRIGQALSPALAP